MLPGTHSLTIPEKTVRTMSTATASSTAEDRQERVGQRREWNSREKKKQKKKKRGKVSSFAALSLPKAAAAAESEFE